MPRSREETESEEFDCPKLGGVAFVELTYRRMDLPDGQRVSAVSGGGCDSAKQCGVGTESANRMSWSFDWSKCVHPKLNRKS